MKEKCTVQELRRGQENIWDLHQRFPTQETATTHMGIHEGASAPKSGKSDAWSLPDVSRRAPARASAYSTHRCPVHLLSSGWQTGQKCVDHSPCGPLMPRTGSRKPPPPPRPSRCDVRKPLRVSLGEIGDEPATEAHHLSNRGLHFGGVYPP